MKSNYKIGDIILCELEKYDVYFPCQIIRLDEKQEGWIALLALNIFSKSPLKLLDIINATPLYQSHYYWKGDVFAFWVRVESISEFSNLGSQELLLDVLDKDIKTSDQFEQIEYQYFWQQLPEGIQEGFKTSIFHKPYRLGNKPLAIDELNNLKHENLYGHEMESNYFDDDLKEFLKDNPLINRLDLIGDLPKTVDISRTYINDLNIEVDNIEELILNKNISKLNLKGNFSKLKTIICPFDGKYLFLSIHPKNDNTLHFKLSGLEKLRIDFSGNLDVTELINISHNTKELYVMGEAATIAKMDALINLKNLEFIWISDVYDFEDFPSKENFPRLKDISLWSVPKAVGDKVKKEYANYSKLDIKQPRTEEWIKANLYNPLRHWDESDNSNTKAKKAIKAYSLAYKKLSKKGCDKNYCSAILKDFIDIFNQIEKKYGLDTIEVEDVYSAFLTLGSLTEFTEIELNKFFEVNIDI